MYLLIFLNSADKFLEPSYIDEVIYANLPTVQANPTGELTKIVISIMLYSLCREVNPYSLCINNAWYISPRCTKYYLCNFLKEISI